MEQKNRPVWVWVISLYYFITLPLALLGVAMAPLVKHLVSEEQKALVNLTAVDYGWVLLNVIIGLIAAILLFNLKKRAFVMFVASFVSSFLMVSWSSLTKENYFSAVPITSWIGMSIGWGVMIAICVYIKKLEKAGIVT